MIVQTPLTPGQGTVLGGLGVLAAGGLAYYGTHRTRVSNEFIADKTRLHAAAELEHEQRKAERTEKREQERAFRSRFTASAAQLADPAPTIRLAGVFSLISLADDWDDFGNTDERGVCVEMLRSYLLSPQTRPAPDDEEAAPFLAVRSQIARGLHARATRNSGSKGSWRSHTPLLSAAQLAYVDLTNADLIRANLAHATLMGAKLSDAKLKGADLSFADLTNAAFTFAKLMRADLSFAKLTGADLSFANLAGADLHDAKLMGADLGCADLAGAKLTDADLTGADLSSATLTGADLTDADLTDVEFDNDTVWPDGTHTPPSNDLIGEP
ncbi:pentapeptide repeat-containing protein [Rhodococcus sp. NBC_00297]|uniref:pentapeptide repeat-containing protein n=1 Tax=Rhodococcus sp. NBC_00297 TaxID=2976005 RepID=UPI002E292A34|nr:pentapeptide repeat-containing protein [Rhodococcus sp. NBC_00297]